MTRLARRLLAGALLSTASPLLAETPVAQLDAYYETAASGHVFTATLRGAEGHAFALFADLSGSDLEPLQQPVVAVGLLDATGRGTVSVPLGPSFFEALQGTIVLRAGYLSDKTPVFSPPAELMLGVPQDCDLLDFDHTLGDDSVMVAGRTIDNQWAAIGLTISAVNTHPAHPDRAILFDTGNVTGGDSDLATPNGAAVGNTQALGNALIIAENEAGAFGPTGLVTVPDDEAWGGSLRFDFADEATVCSVTLIDIDELPGTELRFYRNGNLAVPDEVIPVFSLGDGSVQTLHFFESGLDRFEVFLKGSGAIPMLELIPCPRILDFDESSTGIPLGLKPGEVITNQFASIGVTIEAVNEFVGPGGEPEQNHPDKAILFDSANPTGNDPDLATPNPGVPSNDQPLGLLLILAEDDIDNNTDGYVDDPDDEEEGGEIRFFFASDVTILSARLVDVDASEVTSLRCFDQFDVQIANVIVPTGSDGAVQSVFPNVSGVRRVVLDLGGSGALSDLRFCPDPADTPVEE